MSQTLMSRTGRRARRLVPGRRSPAPLGWAEEKVTWVYAITGDLSPGQLTGLRGVGGEEVRAVAEAGLNAVVGSVDAMTFGDRSLPSLLGDLASIERVGRAHHQVIACVAADGPVLPLRLAAVYPGDSTVRALLARRNGEFAVLLESFRDMEEWGVKVYAQAGTPTAEAAAGYTGGPDALLAGGTGALGDQPGFPDGPPHTFADAIDRALSGIAIARRRYPPPDSRLASCADSMVLNCAYLLRHDRVAEFAAVARALDRVNEGVRTHLTGPWPPYSFAEPQQA